MPKLSASSRAQTWKRLVTFLEVRLPTNSWVRTVPQLRKELRETARTATRKPAAKKLAELLTDPTTLQLLQETDMAAVKKLSDLSTARAYEEKVKQLAQAYKGLVDRAYLRSKNDAWYVPRQSYYEYASYFCDFAPVGNALESALRIRMASLTRRCETLERESKKQEGRVLEDGLFVEEALVALADSVPNNFPLKELPVFSRSGISYTFVSRYLEGQTVAVKVPIKTWGQLCAYHNLVRQLCQKISWSEFFTYDATGRRPANSAKTLLVPKTLLAQRVVKWQQSKTSQRKTVVTR